MDDFLYRNPGLYEQVFPSRSKGELCLRVFDEHLGRRPSSLLDVACGTGRDLKIYAGVCPDCVGFDVTPAMVEYAERRNPGVPVFIGDMRSFRLDREFDAICALGGSINFALSDDELDQTIKTYSSHAHDGTLLVLEPLDSSAFFGQLRVPTAFSVPYRDTTAVGSATYELFERQQVVERTRTWKVVGEDEPFTDSMRFRVIFPGELTYRLSQNGFEVLEVRETPGNELYQGSSTYFVARFCER
jgi:SAM-dependent methyltransferase